MATQKEKLLIKVEEFKGLGLLIGELPEVVKTQELKGLVADAEKLVDEKGEINPIDLSTYFETAEDDKAWYIKNEFFKKFLVGVEKKNKKETPKEVKQKVNYIFLTFSGGHKEQFFKDKPLTESQLALFEQAPNKLKQPLIEETSFAKKVREQEGKKAIENRKKKYLEWR